MRVSRHASALLAIVLVCAFLAGCAGARRSPSGVEAQTVAPRITIVPDLRGKKLSAVRALLDSQDVSVSVTFPSVDMTAAVPAQDIAGTHIPAHIARAHRTGATLDLAAAADKGAAFVVRSQQPAPGRPMTGGIRLTTGAHPGSETGVPWAVTGHITAIKHGGASQCLESCHSETECSDCHTTFP